MTRDLIIGTVFFLLIALGYYYFTHTAEEIITHILLIIFTVVGSLLGLSWGKTLLEELEQVGSRAIRNFFSHTTLTPEFATQNTAREFTDQPRNDHESTAKGSTEASTANSEEKITVSESKELEIVSTVTKFLTDKTKEGKLWLNATSNVNQYLLQIAEICNVKKIVVVETIKRYPDEFRILDGYAHSVTAFDAKQRATQQKKNSTGVVFESTTPTSNSTTDQSQETKKETVYA